jgi:glycosyltransferase involved in cell wall biosynthesis
MGSPLITIGITCFNAADTISRAIKAAMRQDWPNKEIVVVDDASTDSSKAIIEALAQKCCELRIIRHDVNKGYPGALNTIIKAARGEFIAIIDDDDESRQDRLTKQWRRLTDYERLHGAQLVLCYANREVVEVGETKPDHITLAIGREAPEPRGPVVANYLFDCSVDEHHVWGKLGSCTLMARSCTFLALGDFDESLRRCAEWDFAVRAALQGAHFIAVNEPLVTQYRTATADKAGSIPLRYAIHLRHKHKPYLKKENFYLASIAIARARFYGAKHQLWKSRFFLAVGYALLPRSIRAAKLASRLAGRDKTRVAYASPLNRRSHFDFGLTSPKRTRLRLRLPFSE